MNAFEFFTSNHLLALLANIKQQRADLDTVERILRQHHPPIMVQREGEKLLADFRYFHLPISITYTRYEEIRGSQRVPRMDFELHLYDHFYLPSLQPDDA